VAVLFAGNIGLLRAHGAGLTAPAPLTGTSRCSRVSSRLPSFEALSVLLLAALESLRARPAESAS
jgi:hypothetical protein